MDAFVPPREHLVHRSHGVPVAQPNPFETEHRPEYMTHLPPLSAPKGTYSDNPKIVQRGTWTQASPFKEHKFHRHVSDSIANNYSPSARKLTSSEIYEATKFAVLPEEVVASIGLGKGATLEGRVPPVAPFQRSNRKTPRRRELLNIEVLEGVHFYPAVVSIGKREKLDVTRPPAQAGPQTVKLVDGQVQFTHPLQNLNINSQNGFHGHDQQNNNRSDHTLPPINGARSEDTKRPSSDSRRQRASARGPRDAFYRELSGTDVSVYERIPDDVLGDEKENQDENVEDDNEKNSSDDIKSQDEGNTKEDKERTNQKRDLEYPSPNEDGESEFSSRPSSSTSVTRGRAHDEEVRRCMEVQFPPYYYSTHGLSRPSTPTEEIGKSVV